jgi:hypothetical protein
MDAKRGTCDPSRAVDFVENATGAGCLRAGGVLASPSTSASAMLKHVACAAATNSSGLVFPSGSLRSRGPGDGQIGERTATRLDGPATRVPGSRPRWPRLSVVQLASCTAPFGLTRDLSINLHDASYPQRVPPRHSGFTGVGRAFGSGRCKRGQCSACA